MRFGNIKALAKVAKHTLVKHAPEILMGAGAITFVTTIVVASKETVKEIDILEDHDIELGDIKLLQAAGQIDDKAYKKSVRNVYVQTSIKTAKNYIPAVVIGSASMACFFVAFGTMKKRYLTVVAAYTALEESFRKYRERVIAARGADEDIYYLTGNKPKEITEKKEDGTKEKKKVLMLPDGSIASPYAFKFGKYKENGERNNQWTDEPQLLLAYAQGQEMWLNNQLYERCTFDRHHNVVRRGTVMLNEIRDLLGEDPTGTGAICGNRYGNGTPGSNGYIDFRIIESKEIDPETGKEIPCLFINPNVDGMIWDLIDQKEVVPFQPTYDQLAIED